MVLEVGVPSIPLGEIRDERKDAKRRRVKRHGQTHHGATVLGDGLLFRSFKEGRCIGPFRGNRIRREGQTPRGEEHFRDPRVRSRPELRQGYPRYVSNSDGIYAHPVGSFWRAGEGLARRLYQSGIWSNEEAALVKAMHAPLLSTRSW